MRIKDLATRATKLLTGNAWFVVDNGTKVEKAAFSEVVKQGIEEYSGSTLAGSAQTVKSAIDALNSKITTFPSPQNLRLRYRADIDCNNIKDEWVLGSGTNFPPNGMFWYIQSVAYITNTDGTIKIGKQIAYGYSVSNVTFERVCSNGTWSAWVKQPTRAEMDEVNSKQTFNITASTGTWPSEVTLQGSSYAQIIGNVVMIHLNLKIVSDTKKNLLIAGVLPQNMRPRLNVMGIGGDGDTDGICQPFSITTEGSISMWNTKTGTTYVQGDLTYLVNTAN